MKLILSKKYLVFDIFGLENKGHLLKSQKIQITQIFIEDIPLKNQAPGQPTHT